MRLLVECTYVYEHPEVNSGIQRVVRNIIKNLPKVPTNVTCVPVMFQNGSIYQVNQLTPGKDDSSLSRLHTSLLHRSNQIRRLRTNVISARTIHHPTSRLSRLIFALGTFGQLLGKVLSRSLGLVEKILAWLTPKKVDKARAQALEWNADDVLVLLDSSWHADFFPIAERMQADGVKIISVVYDLIPLTHPQFCDEGLVRVFDQWFDWIARTADGFMAISKTIINQVEAEVTRRLGSEHSKQRWFNYFHLGSELDLISGKEEVRYELKEMFSRDPVYLMVSTIEPRKNHAYLLDAFERLWAQDQAVSLCIVGKVGWKTEELVARILHHPELNKRLYMFNDLSDCELQHCYQNARSLVFPSYVEGFGLPLVEAMQRGLPAMASDIDVFREIGGNAMAYFDLNDPDSLGKLIKRFEQTGRFPAKESLKKWSWLSWRGAASQLVERVTVHTIMSSK